MESAVPDPADIWSGSLTLTPGMVVYGGPGGNAATHSHHAVQLIRSFDTPFELDLSGRRMTCTAALVPSGFSHTFSSDSKKLLIALIEPLGPNGSALNEIAINKVGECLDELLSGDRMLDPEIATDEIFSELLGDTTKKPPHLSTHVIRAIEYLDTAIEGKPRLEEAADFAGISPSRLTHLFTREVGIPFRKFILWLRLRRVVEYRLQGANLTECAHAAGFSDSAHLSRVFRANFGLSPSALLGMRLESEVWPS